MGLAAVEGHAISDGQLILSEGERIELAQLVVKVFKEWGLQTIDQAKLLGLSISGGRSTLNRYVNGNPIAQSPDMIWRIGHLLAIYEILHSFDINVPERANKWPTTPNPRLGGVRPVELMQTPDGLSAIRDWLEVMGER